MSKSIYEEALQEIQKVWNGNPLTYPKKTIEALERAKKQEKLLELYKELSNFYVKLYTMELSELSLNSNYYEIELIKLKQRIKELEK